MAFFRTVSFSETMPAILGDGITLRMPQTSDHAEFSFHRHKEVRHIVDQVHHCHKKGRDPVEMTE